MTQPQTTLGVANADLRKWLALPSLSPILRLSARVLWQSECVHSPVHPCRVTNGSQILVSVLCFKKKKGGEQFLH